MHYQLRVAQGISTVFEWYITRRMVLVQADNRNLGNESWEMTKLHTYTHMYTHTHIHTYKYTKWQ